MILTVFRSRLKPNCLEEYKAWAQRLSELARDVPGYVSHKGFVAEDGERVTIVEFASEEALRSWSRHPDHVDAKKKGRSEFYEAYSVQTCTVDRETRFPAAPPSRPNTASR